MPEQNEVVVRLQRLVADASAQQAELMQQYSGLFQKFVSGETRAVDPAKAMQFWIDEGTAYAQRLAEFGLRTYKELFEMNRDLAERYLALAGATAGNAGVKPAASAARSSSKRARRSSSSTK